MSAVSIREEKLELGNRSHFCLFFTFSHAIILLQLLYLSLLLLKSLPNMQQNNRQKLELNYSWKSGNDRVWHGPLHLRWHLKKKIPSCVSLTHVPFHSSCIFSSCMLHEHLSGTTTHVSKNCPTYKWKLSPVKIFTAAKILISRRPGYQKFHLLLFCSKCLLL